MTENRRWRLKGPEMEGPIARWYARVRGTDSQLADYRKQARRLTDSLPPGAQVLEVAPGRDTWRSRSPASETFR